MLTPGRPFALPLGETLIRIGQPAGSPTPVTIRLRRPAASPNAVVMTLTADSAQLIGMGKENPWPSWEEDLRTTWIIFQEGITVGASKDCAVILDGTIVDVAAEIRFHEGFWIKPFDNAQLIVGELPFDEAVPLVAADTSIAGANFKVAHGSRASLLRIEPQLALRSGSN